MADFHERERRRQRVRMIFATLDARGSRRTWLAQQVKISPQRLWTYEHGVAPSPDWFVARACAALGIPVVMIEGMSADTSARRPRRSA